MKIINGNSIVTMRLDELKELLNEIPVEKIVYMGWFQWAFGKGFEKYANLSHEELFDKIFIELEEQP